MTSSVRPGDEVAILEHTERRLKHKETILQAGRLLLRVRLLVGILRDKTFSTSWATRSLILGALLYFLIPADAVPDVLPGVGYVDDGVVLGAVIRQLNREIDRYLKHSRHT
jgi:uncharacterized membrane protein YkvA (DUF1232 family)